MFEEILGSLASGVQGTVEQALAWITANEEFIDQDDAALLLGLEGKLLQWADPSKLSPLDEKIANFCKRSGITDSYRSAFFETLKNASHKNLGKVISILSEIPLYIGQVNLDTLKKIMPLLMAAYALDCLAPIFLWLGKGMSDEKIDFLKMALPLLIDVKAEYKDYLLTQLNEMNSDMLDKAMPLIRRAENADERFLLLALLRESDTLKAFDALNSMIQEVADTRTWCNIVNTVSYLAPENREQCIAMLRQVPGINTKNYSRFNNLKLFLKNNPNVIEPTHTYLQTRLTNEAPLDREKGKRLSKTILNHLGDLCTPHQNHPLAKEALRVYELTSLPQPRTPPAS